MGNWRAISSTLLVLVLAAWTIGCGGSTTATSIGQGIEGISTIPDIPEDRAPSADLPDDPEIREVLGNEYLAMHNGIEDGTALILDAPDGDDSDIAWGVYRFSYLHGYRPHLLTIETLPVDFGDEYWVGVANYTRGAWEWFGPSTLLEFEIDLSGSDDRYITAMGNFYFILLAEPGNSTKHVKSTLICGPAEDPNPPGAPYDLSATDGDFSDKVEVTWEPGEDENGYEVWRADSLDGEEAPDEDTWQRLGYTVYTTYSDFEVETGVVYWYKARAYNYGGYSEFSNVDSGYAQQPPPPPEDGLVWGKVGPIGEDFENMTAYLAGLPDVQEASLNVYGIFQFPGLPWGTYLVTVFHWNRDMYPQYFQVTISPEEPQAWVEFGASEVRDYGRVLGFAWRYDPEIGYVGIYGTKVTIEKVNFGDTWNRITNGYGWFHIGGLETRRYYRVTPTRADMLFTPDNRILFLGDTALNAPLFFKGTLVP